MGNQYKLFSGAKIKFITESSKSNFFGYFDKSPWNSNNPNFLLSHQSDHPNVFPKGNETIDIGYWDISANRFQNLGQSATWNFQQGCMLQWVGKTDQVLYNNFKNQKANAVLLQRDGTHIKEIDYPIAALSSDGKKGVSINFGRLFKVRKDYGYPIVSDPFSDELAPDEDGIHIIDIEGGHRLKLISTKRISEFGQNASVSGAYHWVNHPTFSPDGEKVAFLHRYYNPQKTLYTRLIVYNISDDILEVVISGMASHFSWKSNNEIIAWAGERSLLKSTNKGLLGKLPIGQILKYSYKKLGKPRIMKKYFLSDNYLLFDLHTGMRKKINHPQLVSDGHCNVNNKADVMVTDTYADKKGKVSLLLYKFSTNTCKVIADFYFPAKWDDEVRCDLHPRWGNNAQELCVDFVQNEKRQMMIIDIKDVKL